MAMQGLARVAWTARSTSLPDCLAWPDIELLYTMMVSTQALWALHGLQDHTNYTSQVLIVYIMVFLDHMYFKHKKAICIQQKIIQVRANIQWTSLNQAQETLTVWAQYQWKRKQVDNKQWAESEQKAEQGGNPEQQVWRKTRKKSKHTQLDNEPKLPLTEIIWPVLRTELDVSLAMEMKAWHCCFHPLHCCHCHFEVLIFVCTPSESF